MEAPVDLPLNSSEAISFIVNAVISRHSTHHEFNSPVILSSAWSRLSRIIALSILSIIGSCGNIFLISSICIEDQLKKAANSLLVNIALGDLVVSGCVLPVSIVSLLAMNKNDDYPLLWVCKFQSFLISMVTLVSVLTLALTSIENFMRLFRVDSKWFGKRANITAVVLLTWIFALFATILKYSNEFFTYCSRQKTFSRSLMAEVGYPSMFFIVPIVVALLIHIQIIIDAKKLMKKPNFKPNMAYNSNFSLIRCNFFSFLTFVICWLPFGIVIAISAIKSPSDISDKAFYYSAWLGLSRTCFHSFVYGFVNKNFANAYMKLFSYCCCKTTVSTTRRRQNDMNVPRSDVRVHIIPGYGNINTYTSPQRSHCNDI